MTACDAIYRPETPVRLFVSCLLCALVVMSPDYACSDGRRLGVQIPNVWGNGGQLFAYSGFDGKTDVSHPLVGSTSAEGRGFRFHTKAGPSLAAFAVDRAGRAVAFVGADDEVVAGDLVITNVRFENGLAARYSFVFATAHAVLARIELQSPVAGCAVGIGWQPKGRESRREGIVVQEAVGEWYAGGTGRKPAPAIAGAVLEPLKARGDAATFGWAYSPVTAEQAISALKEALKSDFEGLLRARLSFFENLPNPKLDSGLLRTFTKCASVMKVNACSPEGDIPFPWTTPDRWPHEHMWIWDSGFHALGLRHFAPGWAENALKAVLSKQRDNGFIPHMMCVSRERDSNIVQPPILSWCAWSVYQKTRSRDFLEYCYPRLKAMLLYDCEELDKDKNGLCEWESGGASGMDNSPRFDRPLGDAVDFNSYICNDLDYLARIATALDKPDEARRWRRMRQERANKINQLLWDEDTGFYYDRSPDGKPVRIRTVAGFTPMFAGVCDARQAERLVVRLKNRLEFWRAFPVATVAADEPTFSDDMWRGPTWINFNYFVIEGLRRYGFKEMAAELKRETMAEIARWYQSDGVIYEFYDSERNVSPIKLHRKGKGGPNAKPGREYLGTSICDYNWTAALFIELAMEG